MITQGLLKELYFLFINIEKNKSNLNVQPRRCVKFIYKDNYLIGSFGYRIFVL